ncbi:MAG TPA: hypothetical protein VFJ85_07255 [Acidimicrobiales bacterium]|nr:hypothetical protein [Acidimicrobiales bacterium]
MRRLLPPALVLLALVLLTGGSLVAAPGTAAAATVRTWDGGPDGSGPGTDNLWTTATNWQGDVAPAAGDTLVFPTTAAVVNARNDFPAGTEFEAVSVDGPSGSAGFTLEGNDLGLRSGVSATAGRVQFWPAVTLASDVTVTPAADATIAFGSAMNLNGHRLTLAGSGSIELHDVGGTAPSPGVVVAQQHPRDPGVLLAGTSQATGGARVDSGVLTIDAGARWDQVQVTGGLLRGSGSVDSVTATGGTVQVDYGQGTMHVRSMALSGAAHLSGFGLVSFGGSVQLGGAVLDLAPGWCGLCQAGTSRKVVENWTAPASGQFALMPHLSPFLRDGVYVVLDYRGGASGMDVEARVVDPPAGPGSPAPARPGYWMLGSTGSVYSFGGATNFGGVAGRSASMAATPDGGGYWVVTTDGSVTGFGSARSLGDRPALGAGESVSSISAAPAGEGYWLFTNLGRAFAYGTAGHFGDMAGRRLNGPVLGSVATPSGNGYYMVASDGGIFAFGDAAFRGSMGAQHLNAPVVGLAPDPDGSGYWLVASDGGIFAFDAGFRGSTGSLRLAKPMIGAVAYGDGYLLVASDGGIFSFSSAPFLGSLGANPPADPVVAVTARR